MERTRHAQLIVLACAQTGPERNRATRFTIAVNTRRSVALLSTLAESGVAASPDAGVTPLQRTSLVFAHAAPHAGVLAALQRPGQALGSGGAAVANGFRLGYLQQRRTAG